MAKENLTDFEREFEKQASRYYNYNGPDDLYAIRECSKKLMQKAKEELMKDAVEIEWKSGTMKKDGKEVPFDGGKAKIIIVALED